MPTVTLAVKDGDKVQWTGFSVPVGMYAERGLIFEAGEPYVVGEPTYEGGSILDAEFASALVADGHLALVPARGKKVADPVVPPADAKTADNKGSDNTKEPAAN